MDKNYFEICDAFVILTRQGIVLTSDDCVLTPTEDAELYKINQKIKERKNPS